MMPIATGTYTGNGAATQAIAGLGFQPTFILIHQQAGGATWDDGNKSTVDALNTWFKQKGNAAFLWQPDMVISFDADGFTVGDGTGWGANIYNVNLVVYAYIAFR